MPVKATVTPNPPQPPMTDSSPVSTCVNIEPLLKVTGTGTGVGFHSTLESFNKFKLKREIESELLKFDGSTEEQRALEGERIMRRISRVDLLITSLTFYASLIMQWLTVVSLSTSFPNSLYEIFIGSFNLSQWNFSTIQTIGKISGVTTSMQILIFVISNLIMFFYKTFHHSKSAPSHLSGPTYFGGPFQLFNVLRTKVHEHNKAAKKLDAKLSQCLGIISQLLIIAAAIVTVSDKFPVVNNFARDIQNLHSTILSAGPAGSSLVGQGGSTPQNDTRVDFLVENEALLAKTTLLVSILAIIMTSLLNITAWMADVWRSNQDEIIVYEVFKWITRLMVCEPCCGERSLGEDDEIDEFKIVVNIPNSPTVTTSNYIHH